MLKRDMLANGINRDLSMSSRDREEFMRRANEVAIILRVCRCSRCHRATAANRRWDGPGSLSHSIAQANFRISLQPLRVSFRHHRHENFCNCGSG